jgi:hypothetical protein
MWSPIIGLVKTNRYHFEFHSSPIWNEYHLWSSALSCCGWLASSFDLCLHERIIWSITWNIMTSSLLGVACFSWSTLLISSTKHLKYFLDHHFHVSLPSTILGLPIHRWQAPTLGRSDLFPKNHSWYSLEIAWLIDPSDGLNLMSNPDSFFKSFSFYLFKSISFYQMISNSH